MIYIEVDLVDGFSDVLEYGLVWYVEFFIFYFVFIFVIKLNYGKLY